MIRPSHSGKVTVTIDTRNAKTEDSTETANYTRLVDALPLMLLLGDLCGENTQVFFDFGVISFVNVDLVKLRERFEGRYDTG